MREFSMTVVTGHMSVGKHPEGLSQCTSSYHLSKRVNVMQTAPDGCNDTVATSPCFVFVSSCMSPSHAEKARTFGEIIMRWIRSTNLMALGTFKLWWEQDKLMHGPVHLSFT